MHIFRSHTQYETTVLLLCMPVMCGWLCAW